MQGLVTSYSGTTLVINVTEVGGSGTHADWNLNPVGNTGATGTPGAGNNAYCPDATASPTTYTCPSPTPTVSTLSGLLVTFVPQTTNSGSSTLKVAGLATTTLKQADCSTNLAASALTGGSAYLFSYNGTVFCQSAGAGGSVSLNHSITFSIGNGINVIPTGVIGTVGVNANVGLASGTIGGGGVTWTVVGNGSTPASSCSIAFDVWATTGNSASAITIPTVANKISASAGPSLSSATSNRERFGRYLVSHGSSQLRRVHSECFECDWLHAGDGGSVFLRKEFNA